MTNLAVVCPTFNSAAFVEKTLATLFAQTRKPDQVIFSDDGSTDHTVESLRRCVAEMAGDTPCTILVNAHAGPGASRNAGILAVDAQWVAFLDSDDLWMPEKLETIEAAIHDNPGANLFCHDEVRIGRDGRESPLVYGRRYRAERPLTPQLYFANMFSTSAVTCRRDLLTECGGFDETLMSAQDYELWLRMSPAMHPVFIHEVLGKYVEREGNITSGKLRKRFMNEVRIAWMHRGMVSAPRVAARLGRISLSYVRQYAVALSG